MEITKENIQFIDNYLKNSDIAFFDIRMEMLDHISSAVEDKMTTENLDFYEAFKKYMVKNKKELITRNESLQHFKFKNVVPFLTFCIKPSSVFFAVLVFFILYYFKDSFQDISSLQFFLTLACFMMFIVFIQLFMYKFIIKERLYVVEKSGVVLFFIYQMNQIFTNILFFKKGIPFLLMYLSLIATFLYLIFYTKEVLKHRTFYFKTL